MKATQVYYVIRLESAANLEETKLQLKNLNKSEQIVVLNFVDPPHHLLLLLLLSNALQKMSQKLLAVHKIKLYYELNYESWL